MVALQIRDVPDEVRDRLAQIARERGQSLQTYLLALVSQEARRAENIALLRRMDGRTDGSLLGTDVADEIRLLRHERVERLARLGDRSGP